MRQRYNINYLDNKIEKIKEITKQANPFLNKVKENLTFMLVNTVFLILLSNMFPFIANILNSVIPNESESLVKKFTRGAT